MKMKAVINRMAEKSGTKENRRVARERKTITLMIGMFCKDKHGAKNGALCQECRAVNAYAMERIDKCPFTPEKPTCVKCPVHCYSPAKREQVRQIMRYSGPRMLKNHPILAVLHLFDGVNGVNRPKAQGPKPK